MIRQSTLDKLHEMRLSAMAEAFENQCADAATYQNLSFEDRFGMLVDREWEKRKNSKLQKLIRNAEFRYPNASVEAIEYHPDRNLDKGQMLEFSTCHYITEYSCAGGSSTIIRYYCYIPCTSTLLQATACHIFHTLYVLSFLICY